MPYTPTTWVDDDGSGTVGTAVTATRMNNIETGVDTAHDDIATLQSGKQDVDADLTAIAALATTAGGRALLTNAGTANTFPYYSAANTVSLASLTAAARTVLDDASTADMLTTLGAQPVDADLTSIAALATTTFGRSLLTQASAAAARTTLGAYATTGGSISGTVSIDPTGSVFPPQLVVRSTASAISAQLTVEYTTGGSQTVLGAVHSAAAAGFSDSIAADSYLRSATGGRILFGIGDATTASHMILTTTTLNLKTLRLENLGNATAATDAVNRQFGDGRYQGLDSDLTSIAALATAAFGRSLLTQADKAAARTTLGITVGTTFPASPSDGDVHVYNADTTNGVKWMFQYRSASAHAYKWEFIGGAPLFADVPAEESTTTTGAWVDLATAGPSVTVPLTGDYVVALGSRTYAGGAGTVTNHTPSFGGATPVLADGIQEYQQTVGGISRHDSIERKKTGLAAGTTIVSKYSTNYNPTYWLGRWLRATPIRVSG